MNPTPDQAEPPIDLLSPTCFEELVTIYRAAPDVLGTYLGEDVDLDSLSCAQVVHGLLMASVEVPADFRLRTVNLAMNLLHSQDWSSFIAKAAIDGDPMGVGLFLAVRERDLMVLARRLHDQDVA